MTPRRPVPDVDATVWNAWATALVEAGFTYGEATLILSRCDFVGWKDVHATQARVYRDAGFSPLEIAAWFPFAWPATEAVAWAEAGWRPGHINLLHQALRLPPEALWWPNLAQRLASWRDTGLPPRWAVRYAAAGLTPAEAQHLDQRQLTREDPNPGLALVAALRRPGPPVTHHNPAEP